MLFGLGCAAARSGIVLPRCRLLASSYDNMT